MKKALITGISGQDGSYLTEYLLTKGYEVHGILRAGEAQPKISPVNYHVKNLLNQDDLSSLLREVQPDEVYHLASESHVGDSFGAGSSTLEFNVMSTFALLSAFRDLGSHSRFFFASSSEIFGSPENDQPLSETSALDPQSPYAVSKLAGFYLVKMFREIYHQYACSAILFNHESPRRPETFVTRKITQAAAKIKFGQQDKLKLGDITVRRDWGFAGDYVVAMWKMLQLETPEDFVIGTGASHSLTDILNTAFGHVGLDWKNFVEVDVGLKRPVEAKDRKADISKAKKMLGWMPSVNFEGLIRMMVDEDIKLIS